MASADRAMLSPTLAASHACLHAEHTKIPPVLAQDCAATADAEPTDCTVDSDDSESAWEDDAAVGCSASPDGAFRIPDSRHRHHRSYAPLVFRKADPVQIAAAAAPRPSLLSQLLREAPPAAVARRTPPAGPPLPLPNPLRCHPSGPPPPEPPSLQDVPGLSPSSSVSSLSVSPFSQVPTAARVPPVPALNGLLLPAELSTTLHRSILDENRSRYIFRQLGSRRRAGQAPPATANTNADASPAASPAHFAPVRRTQSAPDVLLVAREAAAQDAAAQAPATAPFTATHTQPMPIGSTVLRHGVRDYTTVRFSRIEYVDDYVAPRSWSWGMDYHSKGW